MPNKIAPGELISAFDPGGTTGVAQGVYLGKGEFKLVRTAQIEWDDFQTLRIYVESAAWIIAERFALYKDKTKDQINNEFPSSQVIGSIRFCAWQNGILHRVVIQPAALRLNAGTLPQHEKLITGNHARDAYRHLRYFCLVNRNFDLPSLVEGRTPVVG